MSRAELLSPLQYYHLEYNITMNPPSSTSMEVSNVRFGPSHLAAAHLILRSDLRCTFDTAKHAARPKWLSTSTKIQCTAKTDQAIDRRPTILTQVLIWLPWHLPCNPTSPLLSPYPRASAKSRHSHRNHNTSQDSAIHQRRLGSVYGQQRIPFIRGGGQAHPGYNRRSKWGGSSRVSMWPLGPR